MRQFFYLQISILTLGVLDDDTKLPSKQTKQIKTSKQKTPEVLYSGVRPSEAEKKTPEY